MLRESWCATCCAPTRVGRHPAELSRRASADVRAIWWRPGRAALFAKARALAQAEQHRRALHLAVYLAQADSGDAEARALVAELCDALAEREPSFIARNFYRAAATHARASGGRPD